MRGTRFVKDLVEDRESIADAFIAIFDVETGVHFFDADAVWISWNNVFANSLDVITTSGFIEFCGEVPFDVFRGLKTQAAISTTWSARHSARLGSEYSKVNERRTRLCE